MPKPARRPALKPIMTFVALLACIALALMAGRIVRHSYTLQPNATPSASAAPGDAATDLGVE